VDPKNGNQVLERAVNTVPDHLLIHGTVQPSQAVVAIIFTGGDEIPGIPVLDWRIQGESGWLRLTSSSMALNVGSPDTKLSCMMPAVRWERFHRRRINGANCHYLRRISPVCTRLIGRRTGIRTLIMLLRHMN
jgi:hypothetical protein